MFPKTLVSLALASAVLAGCSSSGAPPGQSGDPTTDAVAAADAWLELVDGARYDDSWDEAAAFFRGAVPKAQWAGQVGGVRGPLGAVQSREVMSTTPATELPGAPDGEYVVIQYRTSFDHKSSAVETVTPMRDADGVFRVSGYFIR